MPPLVAIIGPTASGKTGLAEALCLRFNGEIVSCDSKQIYRGMDIGSGKEVGLAVPQHLIDIKDPGERVTVAEYQGLAYGCIDGLLGAGKQPFLTGGTMLYAESVLNGYTFGGRGFKEEPTLRYRSLKMGVAVEKERLRELVGLRLRRRVEEGLPTEVAGLLAKGVSAEWLKACGLEYRYFTEYCLGEISLDEAIAVTELRINQYVKRQYTWWRRHVDVQWVGGVDEAYALTEAFLRHIKPLLVH